MSDFTAPGLAGTDLDEQPTEQPEPIDLSVGATSTALEDLEADLQPVVTEPVVIPVENRPGYALRCRTDFTGKDLDKWRKLAKDKSFADGIDGVKLSSLVLGATCIAVTKHGADVLEDGRPVTFQSAAFRGMLGVRDIDPAVRRFFGAEGKVEASARTLLNAAGWGEEVYVLDPTS